MEVQVSQEPLIRGSAILDLFFRLRGLSLDKTVSHSYLTPRLPVVRKETLMKKLKFSGLLAVFTVLALGFVLTGCDNASGGTSGDGSGETISGRGGGKTSGGGGTKPNPAPGENWSVPTALISNSWVSGWGEEYKITATAFYSGWGGSATYEGTIVNHRADGSGAGYITILYTSNPGDTDAVGKYYVIRYENLTSSTAWIAGAGSGTDPEFTYPKAGGKATKQEAEDAYTKTNPDYGNYFSYGSICYKLGSGTKFTSNLLIGTWSETTYSDTFVITDETLTYKNNGYLMFFAQIVNVRVAGNTGYITFKYISNDVVPDSTYYNGDYCVLYWMNYVANTSADIGVASGNWSFGDSGEATRQDAEDTYVYDASDDYFEDAGLMTFNKS